MIELAKDYVGLVITLFFIYCRKKGYNNHVFFNLFRLGLLFMLIVVLFTGSGLGWSHFSTPLSYILFVWFVESSVYDKVGDSNFSMTYSFNLGMLVGYLYEVPMWIMKDVSLLRYNLDSLLLLDYNFISLFVVIMLLTKVNYKFSKSSKIGVLILFAYTVIVSTFYWKTIILRLMLWTKYEMLIYRLPVMIGLALITKDIKKIEE